MKCNTYSPDSANKNNEQGCATWVESKTNDPIKHFSAKYCSQYEHKEG